MHELSIALRIVEALDQELAADGAFADDSLSVSNVAIEVGTLTGLVPEALHFSWDMATEGSILQGSVLEIQMVDAAGYCSACEAEQSLISLQSMRCPACRTPITQITGGNELEILTVEVQNGNHG